MRATIFPIFFASVLAGVLPLAAQKPLPVASAGNYVITAGALAVTVGPSEGGRIRSLKYQGTEMFYVVTGGNPSSLGTTFWPSPQAHWSAACRAAANIGCWEPPVAFDGTSANYTGGVIPADTSVSYTSAADNATPTGTKGGGTRVRIRKTLWGNTMDSSITVRYHIINTDTVKKAFAPWELTRFVTGGLTFYAKSTEDTLKGNGTAGTAMMNMITDTLGVKWHKYDSATVPTSGTAKFWDGTSAGWYAHVDKSRNLYIKKFQDIPTSKKAPIGENQIELYSASRTGTSGGMAYMEMELQGAFDSIAVGDSLTWDVQWFVRKLPDSIPVTRNSALLALVNQIVGTGPVSVLQDLRMSQASLGYVNRRVSFELTTPGQVSLSLVNASGQVVQKIHSGAVRGGRHEFRMNAAPKGVYWLVLKAAGSSGQIHTKSSGSRSSRPAPGFNFPSGGPLPCLLFCGLRGPCSLYFLRRRALPTYYFSSMSLTYRLISFLYGLLVHPSTRKPRRGVFGLLYYAIGGFVAFIVVSMLLLCLEAYNLPFARDFLYARMGAPVLTALESLLF